MSDKVKIELSTIDVPNVTTERYTECCTSDNRYVNYGANNNFPDVLWRLFTQSPTNQSIIEGKVNYILGDGIKFAHDILNKRGDTVEDVVAKIALDQQLFGGFALQVIYSASGDVAEVYWADFSKLRVNKAMDVAFWCDNWKSRADIKAYPIFGRGKGKSVIYYYRGRTCRSTYPIPTYIAAMDAIETEVQIQSYHLNNINNGFCASTIINMNNGVPDEDERKDLEEKIKSKFAGAGNAGRTLICWNDTPEGATTVAKLDADDFDQKFERLSKDTQRCIFVAHRVTSPCLFGIVPENTGFSKQEYQESFEVFNRTVISVHQKDIERAFKAIYGSEMKIEPYTI